MTGWSVADPFELPDWLALAPVIWRATSPLGRARVCGELHARLSADGPALGCDLLGVDEAWPVPVADPALRTAAHQAWRRGDLHLVEYDDRLTLTLPGCAIDAEDALEAVERLARSVGADPATYSVLLVAGGHGRDGR